MKPAYAVTTSIDGDTATVHLGSNLEAASRAFTDTVHDAQFERLWDKGKPKVTVLMVNTWSRVTLAKVRVDDDWADC